MYLTIEASISQNVKVLKEKLQKQYKEQTTGVLDSCFIFV